MLTYTSDSIFNSNTQALVNPVNTVGVMGKGLALEFKKRFPGMYTDYYLQCKNKLIGIGVLHYYHLGNNNFIINFPTKTNWRLKTKLSYIEDGLKEFIDTYRNYGISSVSFPKLGCGLGGLDWENEVKPLMESYLNDIDLLVIIHV